MSFSLWNKMLLNSFCGFKPTGVYDFGLKSPFPGEAGQLNPKRKLAAIQW